jgi:predicted transcriptional regulator of viral defense system
LCIIAYVLEQSDATESLLEFLRRNGVSKASEITSAGFDRVALTRLVKRGEINRLSRGVYAASDHELTEWHDLAEIAKTAPSAVVTLVSALAFHEIGTQMPYETWIALPKGSRKPALNRNLNITRFSEPSYSAGVEEHEIEGVRVRVYSPAKTIADCFKMRSKVGYDVAIEALKEGWRLRKFTMSDLNKFAEMNKVDKVMRPYIEAITA